MLDTMIAFVGATNFLKNYDESKYLQKSEGSLGENKERSTSGLLVSRSGFGGQWSQANGIDYRVRFRGTVHIFSRICNEFRCSCAWLIGTEYSNGGRGTGNSPNIARDEFGWV